MGYNGSSEIKDHVFFSTVDWIELEKKTIEAPFRPRVNGEYDVSNIDRVRHYSFSLNCN